MGWKGTLRSLNALIKRAEREEQKNKNAKLRLQQRELKELQQMQLILARRQAFKNAENEVQEYEHYIKTLITLHTKVAEYINWQQLSLSSAPNPPTMHYKNRNAAIHDYQTFSPSFFQKIFKQTKKIKQLLKLTIEQAENEDKKYHKQLVEKFYLKLAKWESDVELSKKILNYDEEAFNYVLHNKSDLPNFCSNLTLELKQDKSIHISIYISGNDLIPTEIKTFLKSGKVSKKTMPKTRYYEIYQDHFCSLILRAARETFALLPIKTTVITLFDHMLDTSTGYLNDIPILSALIVKETIEKLNLNDIDPSEALKNFTHNMSFKKLSGFQAIEIL